MVRVSTRVIDEQEKEAYEPGEEHGIVPHTSHSRGSNRSFKFDDYSTLETPLSANS